MKVTKECNRTSPEGLLGQYLADLARRRYAPATVRAYGNTLRRLLGFLNDRGMNRLQEVTPDDLAAYRLHLMQSVPSEVSRHHYLNQVRAFFAWLERQQHVFVSPAAALLLPRPGSRLGFVPTQAEMRRLLALPDLSTPAGVRDRAMLETAYSTGCRLGELVGMNVGDCDLGRGLIRVHGKGGKERMVPLGRVAAGCIDRYLDTSRPALSQGHSRTSVPPTTLGDGDALWLGCRGRRINPLIVERSVRAYGRAAGIAGPFTPHALRRACATHMLANGAGPVQIQTMLGHSSLRTLSQYLSVSISDLKKVHARARPGG